LIRDLATIVLGVSYAKKKKNGQWGYAYAFALLIDMPTTVIAVNLIRTFWILRLARTTCILFCASVIFGTTAAAIFAFRLRVSCRTRLF
jgi:hypothetical protein